MIGGMAYNKKLTDLIFNRVSFVAPAKLVPGEYEGLALMQGVLRVLRWEEIPKVYEEEV